MDAVRGIAAVAPGAIIKTMGGSPLWAIVGGVLRLALAIAAVLSARDCGSQSSPSSRGSRVIGIVQLSWRSASDLSSRRSRHSPSPSSG